MVQIGLHGCSQDNCIIYIYLLYSITLGTSSYYKMKIFNKETKKYRITAVKLLV